MDGVVVVVVVVALALPLLLLELLLLLLSLLVLVEEAAALFLRCAHGSPVAGVAAAAAVLRFGGIALREGTETEKKEENPGGLIFYESDSEPRKSERRNMF